MNEHIISKDKLQVHIKYEYNVGILTQKQNVMFVKHVIM